MYVAGSHYRLAKLLAKLYDPAVQIPDVLHRINVADPVAFDHKPVIPYRLALQVIIEAADLCAPSV